jgi:hypothetical protein
MLRYLPYNPGTQFYFNNEPDYVIVFWTVLHVQF